MQTLTLFSGLNKQAKAIGRHQCKLLEFAFFNRGLHSYKSNDRDAKRAVLALTKKGYLEHFPETTQFQWNEKFGK